MKKFIKNNNDLKESDITEVVRRVKILLVNSDNEILLGYSHNEYQFPGGHVEEEEDLITAVNREIEEETGLILNISDIKPFACSIGYWKDWPENGKNRKTEVYYYEVPCDLKPNMDNVNYTEHEKNGNFTLRYILIDDIEKVLLENANNYGDKHGIAKEMLELISFYKSTKLNKHEKRLKK